MIVKGSLIEKAVEALSKIDDFKTVAEGIRDYLDADDDLDKVALAAKIVAELSAGIVVTMTLRTAMSALRLGLAVSGRIGEWEKLSKVMGIASGTGVGELVDFLNGLKIGSRLYDFLHPSQAINSQFRSAIAPRPRDPLAIDLNGNGIEMLPAGSQPVLFDHDADGVKTGTGWLKGDDAWLVLDRNGNGTIDSGRELFGVDTQVTSRRVGTSEEITTNARDGFQALATLDSNRDSVFNAQDDQFNQVRLWQDFNSDGVSQSDELSTLTQKGIVSISLVADNFGLDLGGGNSITGRAVITRADGTAGEIDSVALSGTAANLNLANNPFYREFPDTIPWNQVARALPNMGGSGWVRDLREAMSLDNAGGAALLAAVGQFAQQTQRSEQLGLVDNLLTQWTISTGRGQSFTSDTRTLTKQQIAPAWNEGDYTVVPMRYTIADPVNGAETYVGDYARFVLPQKYYTRSSDGTYDILTQEGYAILQKIQVLEVFNGTRTLDTVANMRYVPQPSGSGGGGGGGGGGVGSGAPNRMELFRVTFRQDQIDSFSQAYEALTESVYGSLALQTRLRPYLEEVQMVIDTEGIRFDSTAVSTLLDSRRTSNLTSAFEDLVDLTRYGYSTLKAVGFDPLSTLRQWADELPPDSAVRAELPALRVFLDGSTNSTSSSDIFLGNAGANRYDGGMGDDKLFGADGADTLLGADGDDVLDGGKGNDSLVAGAGNDSLQGGSGNDTLAGGTGNDVYVFGFGDGKDFIDNFDATAGRQDVLRFLESISSSDLSLVREGDDLLVSLKTSADQVRIRRHFMVGEGVDQFVFADGSTWDANQIASRTQQATGGNDLVTYGGSDDAFSGLAGNDTLIGGLGRDTINGNDGDDFVEAGSGSDVIDAGSGSDVIVGGAGDDSAVGGAGDDSLSGDEGNDTLRGNGGNDTIVGGTGNDSLVGEDGDDVYMLSRGSGIDVVSDTNVYAAPNNVDAIQFTDVASTEVTRLERRGNDLILGYGPGDEVVVQSFVQTYREIEQFRFTDVTWELATVTALMVTQGSEVSEEIYGLNGTTNRIFGYGGNDTLWGGNQADTIDGGAGNDSVIAGTGDDSVVGGEGADSLNGSAGNDTLIGGLGNDSLVGEGGSDLFLISKGDGVDTIRDSDGIADTLRFTDVASTDVTLLERRGNDLVIQYGTTDQVTVTDYFDGASYRIEQVQFTDTTWDYATVAGRVITPGSAGADSIVGLNGTTNRIFGFAGNDSLTGGDQADTIDGGAGNDSVIAGTGDDSVVGGEGADSLNGSAGNDTLIGGLGNDSLVGEGGSDLFLISKGDGVDTIRDSDSTANIVDTLRFTDVASTEVTLLERRGNDLVIQYGTTDQVTVTDYFGGASYRIEQVQFTDVTWDYAALAQRVVTAGTSGNDSMTGADGVINRISGYAGNDTLIGGNQSDTLDGGQGNDSLAGNAGADLLFGGEGNDSLNGSAGDDTLTGGLGNDSLVGEGGSDLFLISKGDGVDTIRDSDSTANIVDTLRFTDVASTEVTLLERRGNDLVIQYGTTDQVTVTDYFGGASYRIEQVQFTDVTWDYAALAQRVVTAGTSGNDSMTGADGVINRISGYAGNDTLIGGNQSDTLDGGQGNDSLIGNAGDDTLVGGNGSDALYGGAGNDLYVFGVDSGLDTVSDFDTVTSNVDTLQFTGVASTDVTAVERQGSSLVIRYGASDQVTVQNQFTGGGWGVEKFQFTDVTWDVAAVTARMNTVGSSGSDNIGGLNGTTNRIFGYDGNDTLYGGNQADTIEGGLGNDSLIGNAGNDTLLGGDGNDTIASGDGADTLVGGNGSDALYGDGGSDVYVFAVGGGLDTVSDFDTVTSNVDTLQFTGVASTDVTAVERQGSSLVIRYGASDQVTVQNQFTGGGWGVEKFQFTDVTWDVAAVTARMNTVGSSGSDNIGGLNGTTNRIFGYDGNDTLYGGNQADTIEGGLGNDSLIGNAGNDTLLGGDGNDTIASGDGADTLVGGNGSDALYGDGGSDVYVFAVGGGLDTVSDFDTVTSNVDTLQFSGVASTDVTAVERQGSSLVIHYGASDQVTVQNQFTSGGWGVEKFQFTDVTWDMAAINARIRVLGTPDNDIISGLNGTTNRIYGFAGNDSLTGGDQADTIDGGAGNDSVIAGTGDDSVVGGEGADSLNGSAGNDTLIGGLGNDSLVGEGGSDLFLISKGDGVDTIRDSDGIVDTLRFTDVASSDVTLLERRGNDLVIQYGTTDQVTVTDYFNSTAWYRIEQIQFSDTTWDYAALVQHVVTAGTSGNDSMTGANGVINRISGYAGNDTLIGGNLSDTLDGGQGNDSLAGNAGSDLLFGGEGNDTLVGGLGNDVLNGEGGNDVFVISRGDGVDVVGDFDSTANNVDVLRFTDVASTDVTLLERRGNDLVIQYGTTDQVTVTDYFGGASYRIEQVQFTDMIWDYAALDQRVVTAGTSGNDSMTGADGVINRISGYAGNDTLIGGSLADTLDGGLGDDSMVGNAGNDVLLGGKGNDRLDAGSGTDTLVGGLGDDTLDGGTGADTYVFGLGGDPRSIGSDVIVDTDSTLGVNDVVNFIEGITLDNVTFGRQGDDLVASIALQFGDLTIRDWYLGADHQIEEFRFDDGSTLTAMQAEALAAELAAFDPPPTSDVVPWGTRLPSMSHVAGIAVSALD